MEISEFQRLMKDLYFQSDSKRGLHRTALWLTEEIGELMRQLKKKPENIDLNNVKEEMADILAWIASIANILDISLDKAIQEKYPNFCPRCKKNPCICNK